VIDIYYLKGGVAMEMRYARAARTAKDFDLGLTSNRREHLRRLAEVLQLGIDDFRFRLKGMELADTIRVEVAIEYRTRAWQTIEVDIGPGQAGEVDVVAPAIDGVAEMGIPVTPQVPCPGINEQIAQKLHACTGPLKEGRARDVLDILVMNMLGRLDRVRARAAAVRIFAVRNTHAFPPETEIPEEWNAELESWRRNWDIARGTQKKFRRNSVISSLRLSVFDAHRTLFCTRPPNRERPANTSDS